MNLELWIGKGRLEDATDDSLKLHSKSEELMNKVPVPTVNYLVKFARCNCSSHAAIFRLCSSQPYQKLTGTR